MVWSELSSDGWRDEIIFDVSVLLTSPAHASSNHVISEEFVLGWRDGGVGGGVRVTNEVDGYRGCLGVVKRGRVL